MEIIACDTARVDALVDFVARLNGEGRHHIGYFGIQRADIAQTLRALAPPLSEGFRLAYDQGELVGVLGVEADPELGRAWLFGPLVCAAGWQRLADELYSAVLPAIPAGIGEHELFCDASNLACQVFAERQAFTLHSEASILYRTRDGAPAPQATRAQAFDARFLDQLELLHRRLFPRTYATAQQLVDGQQPERQVCIAADGDALQGYIAFKVQPAIGECYIDFLGVAEPYRQQGLGRQLLDAAVARAFAAPEVQVINLTVNSSNAAALKLYRGAGFVEERRMRCYRRAVPR